MSSLGQKIRTLRQVRKLTQRSLGQGLVTPSMISQIESDRALPSLHLLRQLADRLNVEPAYFDMDAHLKSDRLNNYRRARSLMDSSRYEEALTYFQSLLTDMEASRRDETLFFSAAQCYIQLGRFIDAARVYETALKIFMEKQDLQNAVYCYYYLGHLYARLNRTGVARMYWQRASDFIHRHPNLSEPIAIKIESGLARMYLELGQQELAQQSYRRASVIAGQTNALLDLASSYEGLGKSCMESQDYANARSHLQRAFKLFTDVRNQQGMNQTSVNLAINRRLEGDAEGARVEFERLQASDDFRSDQNALARSYYESACCLSALGGLERARSDLKEAVNHETGDIDFAGRVLRLLIQMLLRQGQHHQALEITDKALGLIAATNDIATVMELYSLRQEIYLQLGQRLQAVANAQIAAEHILKAHVLVQDASSRVAQVSVNMRSMATLLQAAASSDT